MKRKKEKIRTKNPNSVWILIQLVPSLDEILTWPSVNKMPDDESFRRGKNFATKHPATTSGKETSGEQNIRQRNIRRQNILQRNIQQQNIRRLNIRNETSGDERNLRRYGLGRKSLIPKIPLTNSLVPKNERIRNLHLHQIKIYFNKSFLCLYLNHLYYYIIYNNKWDLLVHCFSTRFLCERSRVQPRSG